MAVYYNEIEPYVAEWLRNLIAAGHLPDGDVDERDIREVSPDDLRPYIQAHFFAGLGGWPYALRLAGWPDDKPVWTGSCPCQPFSGAGKGAGFDDERHLWPDWFRLIGECRPATILGEQVASKDGLAWLDLVQTDLETAGYASGAVDLCSAGIGAPHIRQRLWIIAQRGVGQADAYDAGLEGRVGMPERPDQCTAGSDGMAGVVEHAESDRRIERRSEPSGRSLESRRGSGGLADAAHELDNRGWHAGKGRRSEHPDCGPIGGLGESDGDGRQQGQSATAPARLWHPAVSAGRVDTAGPVNGFWRDADWLLCRDGRWRPVEPGTQPLAHGVPARVGQLRAYGNAITAQCAQEFIQAVMEVS